MENKRIYLSSPTIHGEEQEFVQEAFDTNWVAPLGPNVNEFEKELAKYVGIPHAAALSAGTAAIHLALKLAGVEEGDVVFVTSLTFSATCNPIAYEKATPVFIDSERDTWNMAPEALEKAYEKYCESKADTAVQDMYRRLDHMRWLRFYTFYNWNYGPFRHDGEREHPMLCPYSKLTLEQKQERDAAWEILGNISSEL